MAFNSKKVINDLGLGLLFLTAACSHAPKKTPELSKMEGKKVAVVEIDGPDTSRPVVETALVNQLIQHGSFILIPKNEVSAARLKPGVDSADPVAVAREAGADFALCAKIILFDATTRDGYSDEEVEDSLMEKETGESKTRRLFKVHTLSGTVEIQIQLTETKNLDRRTGTAESHQEITAESRTDAAHLPPKLRFLENLTNEAFRKFFEQYN